MLASSKKEPFDDFAIRGHLSKARESHALVAPWEQEEDPENYISSQFINFLDSKMKNPELLKKASTLLESSTIPDIESYTQNLTRSAITDESPMQKEQKLLSRQRIAEKALDKGKDSSISITMSFSKKKSDLEEVSLEGSGIMQKQPSLKKEASLPTSSGLTLVSQMNNRPKGEYHTKKSVEYKPKSMNLKRPSTGISYNREGSIKSPEGSSQFRGSLLKAGTFFEFSEAEGSPEKEIKEAKVVEHEGIERIRSARKEKYRSSKTISDSKAFLHLDNDTKDITEAITKKSDFKPYLKSSETLDNQMLNEAMQGSFNSYENDKNSLAYILSANMPDNEKTPGVRQKSLKIARNIKTSGMRSRRSGVISSSGVNSGISLSHKPRDQNHSISIQALQPPSLLFSSNIIEDRLTPVKKSMINVNNSTPQRSSNQRFSISEDRELPVGVQPFVENRASIFSKQVDNNNEKEEKEEKEEEKVDIQDSIRFTNKLWNTHKDQFSNPSVSQFQNFKRYGEEKEKGHRREASSERIVNLNAQVEKFQITISVRPNRPETASNIKRAAVSPQKMDGITFEKAKRYLMNKTFRVKENSVLQKSLERIRMKATLDVSKSLKLHNLSNLNRTEDEQDYDNKKGQEKLKNLLGSPANAIFIAGAPSGSVSANYQTTKEITIQTSDQVRQLKRPRLKRNI